MLFGEPEELVAVSSTPPPMILNLANQNQRGKRVHNSNTPTQQKRAPLIPKEIPIQIGLRAPGLASTLNLAKLNLAMAEAYRSPQQLHLFQMRPQRTIS
mmetsp:Transcript_10104/g.17609  ORF Transcript_10104/g.17609 Transcript_10104/m.17609 type:complete len:99 (-) Transcript_10104:1127-1423(-)